MAEHPLIAMRGIVKRYPGVTALRDVNLTVEPGEVMALVGENGAGKSTLLKILAGAARADEGVIEVSGEIVNVHSPRESQSRGIAVIYQELNLANDLSVAENIYVGREPRTRFGTVDFRAMRDGASRILTSLGIRVSPDQIVGNLNIALRQMVEIAKALLVDARVVVMDEPTSSLTEEEVATLLNLVRQLRSSGISVIYVSHRMREIFEIADRITVMRDGSVVGVRDARTTRPSDIVQMMVGRELEDLYGVRTAPLDHTATPTLEVRNLSSGKLLHDVSFCVRPGEILALAGLIGAGRSDAALTIFGAAKRSGGEIIIDGQPMALRTPNEAMEAGIGFVPEDRKSQGLFLGLPVRENMSSASLSRISRMSFVSQRRDRDLARQYAKQLGLRESAIEVAVGTLSGGNQQKVVLARWLARLPKLLILDEPTRGVDVGAKAEIYQLIRKIAGEGVAVLVISSELTEVLGIADRILVMREGYGVGELTAADATEKRVMAMATGVQEDVS
ncbi:sugar ABC transporter ATP-binding protein [Cryobacterium sp. TmT2-59]|uniref:sugar ABC transporter ATP-binding protein n=1 Tax=unclassified Cryobacterium TaxID=2649013 RepID=UPI0010690390|nr:MULTISPECIES: sugar ABC transporter ATP-binding protein [unclassified Cryobacterium]TFC85433.1 sugar ABC transporter ATP-binding protein [Cryobacterium sp. TmT2-59]TFD20529.1 sugar ABC transporter ATP-binding protein [Cryobacterium sp. TMT2-23]